MRLQEHVGRQSAATAPRRGESARGKRAKGSDALELSVRIHQR
jgi:hypothetical protein